MVALLDKSPVPSKTALRARGAPSSFQSHRATELKSSKRIGLGHFTYDNCRRLDSCSKDPITYAAGSNCLYEYCHSKPYSYVDPWGMQIMATMPPGLSPFPGPVTNPNRPVPSPVTKPGPIWPSNPPNIRFPRTPTKGCWQWIWFEICVEVGKGVDSLGQISASCVEHDCKMHLKKINACLPSPTDGEEEFCNCATIAGLWEADYGRVKSINWVEKDDCNYPPDMCVGPEVKVGDKVL